MSSNRTDFKDMPAVKRRALIIGSIAATVCVFLIVAYAVGSFNNVFKSEQEHSNLWYGTHTSLPITLAITGMFVVIALVVYFRKNPQNTVDREDDRGVKVMKNDDFGGSRYMVDKELCEVYEVGDIHGITTPVYGQLTRDGGGKDVVAYKKRKHGASGNQNVLVLASMGSGKSFGPVRVNLIQALRRKESFVVTDPSGELYRSLGSYAESMGAKVQVLNLSEPDYSAFWNVLEETIDPETERLDSTRLDDFATIYMKNSGESDKEDFWYGCALTLIQTAIGYVAYKHEKEVTDGFATLYSSITGQADDDVVKHMKNTTCSFKWCKDTIRKVAEENGCDMAKIDEALYAIQYIKPKTKFNIAEVYNLLLDFNSEKTTAALENIPSWHPAYDAYIMYKTASKSDSIRDSALLGAQLRFKLFKNEKIREMLSHDGMHIDDITKDLSAYFIIISDKTTTTKPIASLFFSFLFKDAQDAWDREATIAAAHGTENPRHQLTCMLDEFYSVGVIGGSPGAFGVTMSNSRKREIHIWVIVQSYSQLAALYGPEIGNVIQGGCSTLLYLGGNDPDTVKFISDFAAGEATVQGESHSTSTGLFGGPNSPTSNLSTHSRVFITPEEARRWRDNVLVVRQGEYMAKIKPFPWIEHPEHAKCKDISIYDRIVPLPQRLSDIAEEAAKISNPDKYVSDLIREAAGRIVESASAPLAVNAASANTYANTADSAQPHRLDNPEAPKPNSRKGGMGRGLSRTATGRNKAHTNDGTHTQF